MLQSSNCFHEPNLLLEATPIENAITVLYRSRLKGTHKKNAEVAAAKADGLNSNTLGFKAAMFRAAKFSDEIEERIGLFTKLVQYRNTFAHGLLREVPWGEATNFLGRVYWPTMEVLAGVLDLELGLIVGDRGNELKELSEQLVAEEKFAEAFEQKLAEHREVWETREEDAVFFLQAKKSTAADTKENQWSDSRSVIHTCPACDNDAVLVIDVDYDGSPGDWYLSGVFVTSLYCHFCDLELTDQEEVDYLKLNEYLHDN